MSHGGLITGDLSGKIGGVVTFNKSGLRLQRGHNSKKNTSGSDAQWLRWIRMSVCSKAWKWLKTNGYTQLSQNEFVKLNFSIAPLLTYEQYLTCDCALAPWRTNNKKDYLKSTFDDFYLGEDWGFLEDLVIYPVKLGVYRPHLQKNLGISYRFPLEEHIEASSIPPTEVMKKTFYEYTDGVKWAILSAKFPSFDPSEIWDDPIYPTLFPSVSVVSNASDAWEGTHNYEMAYRIHYEQNIDILFTLHSYPGDPGVMPPEGIHVAGSPYERPRYDPDYPEMFPNIYGNYGLSGEWIPTRYKIDPGQLPDIAVEIKTLSFDYNPFEEIDGYSTFEFFLVQRRNSYFEQDVPIIFTAGGFGTSYFQDIFSSGFGVPYYYQYTKDSAFIQRSIQSWRDHRIHI